MKEENIQDIKNILTDVLTDSNISSESFRILFYILHIGHITYKDAVIYFGFTSKKFFYKCLDELIDNGYVNIHYSVNNSNSLNSIQDKPDLTLNESKKVDTLKPLKDDPFEIENKLFNYFQEKISPNKNINFFHHRKQIQLMIEKDRRSISDIYKLIDHIVEHNIDSVKYPKDIRDNFDSLISLL